MTPAETLAKSKQLDRFLGKAVTDIRTSDRTAMNKFAELAARSAALRKSLDQRADKLAARFDAFPAAAEAAFAPHEALADETERGFKEMEDALRDLVGHNGGPLLGSLKDSGEDVKAKTEDAEVKPEAAPVVEVLPPEAAPPVPEVPPAVPPPVPLDPTANGNAA